MKNLMLATVIVALTSILISCGNNGEHATNAKGFSEIEKEIKEKFGDDAFFTDIVIVYDKSIGNMINVTVTTDPESLKMEQWIQSQGTWQQKADIKIEIPSGTNAADFMYQLDDKINLATLGELVEKSKKDLKAEKDLENPTLSTASILFPKNGDLSKTEYAINLQPENGGTTFRFYYNLKGNLRTMNY